MVIREFQVYIIKKCFKVCDGICTGNDCVDFIAGNLSFRINFLYLFSWEAHLDTNLNCKLIHKIYNLVKESPPIP